MDRFEKIDDEVMVVVKEMRIRQKKGELESKKTALEKELLEINAKLEVFK